MRISPALFLCVGILLLFGARCTDEGPKDIFGAGGQTGPAALELVSNDPGNINTEVDTGFTLHWELSGRDTTDKGPVVYRVYLGSDSANLSAKNLNPPSADSLHIAGLDFSTTYYWTVTAVVGGAGGDTVSSGMWTFTTRRQPPALSGWKVLDKYCTQLADNEITAMTPDTAGNMWVGTRYGGLYQFRNDAVYRSVTHANTAAMPSCAVFSLVCNAKDTLWIGTSSNGLLTLARDTLRVKYEASPIGNIFTCNSILSLGLDTTRLSVVVGSSCGNRLFVPQKLQWKLPDSSAMCRAVPPNRPWSMAWISAHQFWVGAGEELTLDSVSVQRPILKTGCRVSRSFVGVDTTKEPPVAVWRYDTTKNISDTTKCVLDTFYVHTKVPARVDTVIDSIVVWVHAGRARTDTIRHMDTTWDTTGYYYYDATVALQTYNSTACSSLAGGINDIAVDQQQRVWIATAKNGVVRFDGQQWTQYHAWNNTAMQSDVVFSISVDRSNRVWIGTDKGIVIYDNP